jgi:predicted aspartyl protease
MTARDVKRELEETHGVSTRGALEKEDLVRRLIEARSRRRMDRQQGSGPVSSSSASSSQAGRPNAAETGTISTQLYRTSLGADRRVAAEAVARTGSAESNGWRTAPAQGTVELAIEPSAEYATIRAEAVVPSKVTSSEARVDLCLLVDTACSGIVLRPEAVRRCNIPALPTAAVSLTGAGGGSAAGQPSAVELRLLIEGTRFGPLPAAVQDIGALPPAVDGIIGLSFLSMFDTVTMDFSQERLVLKRQNRASNRIESSLNDRQQLASVADESRIDWVGSWGICSVPVWLGSRGPTVLLVDTGAACTLLHPRGVRDLGLDVRRDTSVIAPLPVNAGAMGSDSVAIRLTHRLYVSTSVGLSASMQPTNLDGKPGAAGRQQCAGVKLKRRVPVDIGSIPLLDQLQAYRVGGILGMDILSQCDAIEMSFRGPRPYLKFLVDRCGSRLTE